MTSSGNLNLSVDEAVENTRRAASSALKLALRARAVAIEKAEIAAKAMSAAKSALDLVASMSEEEENKEIYLKKNQNRMKKNIPVQALYKKKRSLDNPKCDEELPRNLHRSTNSSPRISKCSSVVKNCKNKRLKFDGNGSVDEVHNVRVDESTSKFDKLKAVEDVEEAGETPLGK